MKTKIITILLFFSIFLCTTTKAENGYLGIETDKFAHFGISYVGQTVLYGIAKKQMKLDQLDSIIISSLGMFAAGVLWETVINDKMDKKDILANTVGQAAAITTILVFDF